MLISSIIYFSSRGPAADITSTPAALMAEMMERWTDTVSRRGSISREDARRMLFETMLGTAILLTEKARTAEDVRGPVATKGGITEWGPIVLKEELPGVFDHVFAATSKRRSEVRSAIASESR